jgi:hypothetical protein
MSKRQGSDAEQYTYSIPKLKSKNRTDYNKWTKSKYEDIKRQVLEKDGWRPHYKNKIDDPESGIIWERKQFIDAFEEHGLPNSERDFLVDGLMPKGSSVKTYVNNLSKSKYEPFELFKRIAKDFFPKTYSHKIDMKHFCYTYGYYAIYEIYEEAFDKNMISIATGNKKKQTALNNYLSNLFHDNPNVAFGNQDARNGLNHPLVRLQLKTLDNCFSEYSEEDVWEILKHIDAIAVKIKPEDRSLKKDIQSPILNFYQELHDRKDDQHIIGIIDNLEELLSNIINKGTKILRDADKTSHKLLRLALDDFTQTSEESMDFSSYKFPNHEERIESLILQHSNIIRLLESKQRLNDILTSKQIKDLGIDPKKKYKKTNEQKEANFQAAEKYINFLKYENETGRDAIHEMEKMLKECRSSEHNKTLNKWKKKLKKKAA